MNNCYFLCILQLAMVAVAWKSPSLNESPTWRALRPVLEKMQTGPTTASPAREYGFFPHKKKTKTWRKRTPLNYEIENPTSDSKTHPVTSTTSTTTATPPSAEIAPDIAGNTDQGSVATPCSSANALYFSNTIIGVLADSVKKNEEGKEEEKGEEKEEEKFYSIRGLTQVAIGAVILAPALVHRVSFVAGPNSNVIVALGDQSPLVRMTTKNSSESILLEPEVMTTFVGLEITCDEGHETFIEHLYIDVNPDVCCEMNAPIKAASFSASSAEDGNSSPSDPMTPATSSTSPLPLQPEKMCKIGQKCVNLSASEIGCVDI